jgi:hypothetical protein
MFILEVLQSFLHAVNEWQATPSVVSMHLTVWGFASQFGLLLMVTAVFGMAVLRARSSP